MRVFLLWGIIIGVFVQAQILFQDDFGTTFGSIDPAKWVCNNPNSPWNSSLGPCTGIGDYGVVLNSSQYITTQAITIPLSGATLTFEYSYDGSYAFPTVEISTSGCWGTFSVVQTLSQVFSCTTITIDLSAYAGQTIQIRFQAGWTSLYDFYLDNVQVSAGLSGGGAACNNCIGSNCLRSTQSGQWSDCNTWENGSFCFLWNSFQMNTRSPVIRTNVTVSGFIPSNLQNCQSIYIQPGATLTFQTGYTGNQWGNYVIEVCGTLNIDTWSTVDFSNFDLIIHNGGVVNVNNGTFKVGRIIIENGGVMNLNGGEVQRPCIVGSLVGLEIQQGGSLNINSSSARLSTHSCFGTPYTIVDGTIDCKNSLSAFNYSNIKLGYVRVTNNTSTGRIRTQTAYLPQSELLRSANNNFWGFNSEYGGTVEYYGSSPIFMDFRSRREYYTLEVNAPLYIYGLVDVVGVLRLKNGTIYLNGNTLRVHGTIVYQNGNYIAGTPTSTLEVVGKLPTPISSGLATYLIQSDGVTNINIRNIPLRFSPNPGGTGTIGTLRIYREDVVILESNLNIYQQLRLERGILKTSYTALPIVRNTASDAVVHTTTGWTSLYGFVSGPLRRYVAATGTYDFPVGYQNMTAYYQNWDVTQPLPRYRRLQIELNNNTGISYLTVHYNQGINPCNGQLTATEGGASYIQLHPEGSWQVVPDAATYTVNYGIKLYTWEFDTPALIDNQYAVLKRIDNSTSCADWNTGGGTLPPANTLGRIRLYDYSATPPVDTSFAWRFNLTNFSEFAIGMLDQTPLSFNALAVRLIQQKPSQTIVKIYNDTTLQWVRLKTYPQHQTLAQWYAPLPPYHYYVFDPQSSIEGVYLEGQDWEGNRYYSNVLFLSPMTTLKIQNTQEGLIVVFPQETFIQVYDIQGKLLYQGRQSIHKIPLDTETFYVIRWNKGVYKGFFTK